MFFEDAVTHESKKMSQTPKPRGQCDKELTAPGIELPRVPEKGSDIVGGGTGKIYPNGPLPVKLEKIILAQ